MQTALDLLLDLPAAVCALIVFAFPLLEASTLLGLIVPGELAVLAGGVLVHFGKLPLWLALAAAVAGAVIGDSLGYFVGRRYGERVRRSRVGRWIGADRLRRADAHLRRRGALDVVIARFPPVLRTLVPGAAGMARVRYRKFLAANVAGGLVWATASVVLGLLAGAEWKAIERAERWIWIAALALVAAWLIFVWARRRRRRA